MILQNKRFKRPEWTAAIATFAFGMAVHLFGLMNILHNHDDIYHQPQGYGAGIQSGRWLLHILGEVVKKTIGNYDLAYFDGVVFIAFLAVSAGFLASVYSMKSRKLAALAGMILVCYPSMTCTMFYRYTTPYYGFAFLCAVLAVWVIDRSKFGFLFSAALTCAALGIYQAYLPITAAMFVLLMIKQGLTEDVGFVQLLKRGLYYCGSMVAGLVLYYVAMQGSLLVAGVTLDDYQGISSMGSLSLAQIPELVWQTLKAFVSLVTEDYCDLAQNGFLKLCYLLTYLGTAAMVVWTLIRKKKSWDNVLMVVLLGMVFPIAANAIRIMCPDSDIRTLMVYGMAVVLIAPLVLVEALPPLKKGRMARRAVIAVALTAVLNYGYLTQVNYTAQYFANRQAENYMNALVTQVRMTEGFDTDKRWALVGYIVDPLLENNPWRGAQIYEDNKTGGQLINAYSRTAWLKHYFGYNVTEVKGEELQALRESEAVRSMPCWPAAGSIQIIDDIVVIRFQ